MPDTDMSGPLRVPTPEEQAERKRKDAEHAHQRRHDLAAAIADYYQALRSHDLPIELIVPLVRDWQAGVYQPEHWREPALHEILQSIERELRKIRLT